MLRAEGLARKNALRVSKGHSALWHISWLLLAARQEVTSAHSVAHCVAPTKKSVMAETLFPKVKKERENRSFNIAIIPQKSKKVKSCNHLFFVVYYIRGNDLVPQERGVE